MARRRRRSLLGRGAAGGAGGADEAPPPDADRADELRNEDLSTEVTDVADPSPPPPDETPPPVRPAEAWPLRSAARRRSTGSEPKRYDELDPAIRQPEPIAPSEPIPAPPAPAPEPVVAPARPRLSLFEAARARLAAESVAPPAPPPAPPPLVAMAPPGDDPPTPATATPVLDGSGQSWLNCLAGRALPDDPVTPPSPQSLVDRARRRPTGPTPPSPPTAEVVEKARAGKLYTATGVRSDDTSDPSWRDDSAPPVDERKTWAPPTRVPTPASAPPPPASLFDTPPAAPQATRRHTNPSLLPEPRLVTVEPPRLPPIVVTANGAVPAPRKATSDDDDEAEPPPEDLFQNPWVLGAVALAVPVLLISFAVVLFFGWSTPEAEVRPPPPPTPVVPPPPVLVPGDPTLPPPAPVPPPTAAPTPPTPPPASPATTAPAPAVKTPPKPLIKVPKVNPKKDPAQTGRLKLRSNQQVLVKVNGRPADFTPFELDLAPDTYRITAALAGKPDSEQTQSVTVVAGDTLPVSFSF